MQRRLVAAVAYHTLLGSIVVYNQLSLNCLQPYINEVERNSLFARTFFPADEASRWAVVSSAYQAGIVVALLIAPSLLDHGSIGRKHAVVSVRDALLLASLCLQFGGGLRSIIEAVLVGRLLGGVAHGIHAVGAILFLNECAPKYNRGACSVFVLTGNALWQLLAFALALPVALGTDGRWPWYYALPIPLVVAHWIGGAWLPRSPKFLYAIRGDRDEATKALRFYHGKSTDFQDVFDTLDREASLTNSSVSWREMLTSRHLRWSLGIVIALGAAPALNGEKSDNEYFNPVLQKVGFSQTGAMLYCIGWQLLRLPFGIWIVPRIIEGSGRRVLVIGAMLLLLCNGLILWTLFEWVTLGTVNSIALFTLSSAPVIAACAFGLGYQDVLLAGELCPLTTRARSLQASGLIGQTLGVVALVAFPPAFKALGGRVWLFYAACSLLLAGAFYRWLPETRGRDVDAVLARWVRADDDDEATNERKPLLPRRDDDDACSSCDLTRRSVE